MTNPRLPQNQNRNDITKTRPDDLTQEAKPIDLEDDDYEADDLDTAEDEDMNY